MKTIILSAILVICTAMILQAQETQPQKPVKTGNEWKMPGDVFKRSHHFADSLKKELSLDEATTKKVYEAYLTNTKPVDEITIMTHDEKEKTEKLKANHEAFKETLKGILSPEQFQKYLKTDAKKNKPV